MATLQDFIHQLQNDSHLVQHYIKLNRKGLLSGFGRILAASCKLNEGVITHSFDSYP